MNLHVFNDEKFFDPFVNKLEQLQLLGNNKFIVRRGGNYKYIKRTDAVFASLDSVDFNILVGKVEQYDRVFLHAFTSDLKRWVVKNKFRELNWMIWGSELYEAKGSRFPLFEPETRDLKYRLESFGPFKYLLHKVKHFLQGTSGKQVFSKVDYLLTWIKPEYEYAVKSLAGLNARQKYFLYGFDMDIEELAKKFDVNSSLKRIAQRNLKCIVGNSGAVTNNHIDVFKRFKGIYFEEILLPVSYGDKKYVGLLKNQVEKLYPHLNISFMERFLSFDEYLEIFDKYSIFINNSLRPLGMGNIWLALLTGKLVFMNPGNFMFRHMKELGLQVFDIDQINDIDRLAATLDQNKNRRIVLDYLSRDKTDQLYRKLFGRN